MTDVTKDLKDEITAVRTVKGEADIKAALVLTAAAGLLGGAAGAVRGHTLHGVAFDGAVLAAALLVASALAAWWAVWPVLGGRFGFDLHRRRTAQQILDKARSEPLEHAEQLRALSALVHVKFVRIRWAMALLAFALLPAIVAVVAS